MRLEQKTIDELTVDDERSFRHVALHGDLHEVLRRARYKFRVAKGASWDRVLFLNLTYWSPAEGGDVLESAHIPADVVDHVAWHHLANRAFATDGAPSRDALFFAEAVASAFDLYLVGRVLGHAPDAEILATQVPRMAEVAEGAGVDEAAFEAMLEAIARDPEEAFESLRRLLFDASLALADARDVAAGAAALDRFEGSRFAPLLHHYELSNWVLFARAHASSEPDPRVRELDAELRRAPVALDVLEARWVRPALEDRA